MNHSEHSGVPTRPPASAHMMVSSTDRYNTFFDRLVSPTTSADWKMNKAYNLLYGYFTRMAITQIQFEWFIPTIVEGKNSDMFLTIDDVQIYITIPTGFYSPTTLAAEIQTLVRADADYDADWNFTVTGTTDAFVFDVDSPYEITFEAPYPDDVSSEAIAINRLYLTMGFYEDNFEPADRIVTGIPLMLYTRYLDICSSRLTNYQKVKDATTMPNNLTQDVIARVYPVPPGQSKSESFVENTFDVPFTLCIDYNTPKHIRWSPDQAVNNFDIRVFDEFGELMYWSPEYASEYQLTFLASET
jgi:hypothetical protein